MALEKREQGAWPNGHVNGRLAIPLTVEEEQAGHETHREERPG
ncbi:hypothetical protein MY3296_009891, partial [Beauveria thailandica]